MIPSRVAALASDMPSNYKSPDLPKPVQEDTDKQIKVWEMSAGKVTKLKFREEILCIREDLPEYLTSDDLIKTAKNFFRLFDIRKSVILKKAIGKVEEEPNYFQTRNVTIVPNRTKIKPHDEFGEDEGLLGKLRGIPIYKNRIEGFYRRFPSTFSSGDLLDYFNLVYDGIAKTTAENRSRAYSTFMMQEKFIVNDGRLGQGHMIHFRFIEAPFGVTPAAQSDFDPECAKMQMHSDLTAMRRSD